MQNGHGSSKSPRSDEKWLEETGRKWPKKRPLDKNLLVDFGLRPDVADDALKRLEREEISSVGVLVATYGHGEGVEGSYVMVES